MSRNRRLFLLALLFAAVFAGSPARADDRCYYTQWKYYPERNYYYCGCYFKAEPVAVAYDYHYVIHYPTTPRYSYYYNAKRSKFWGRYDLESAGYSLLEEKDRRGSVKEIPEEAFPKPGEMPAIPGSTDGAKLTTPPAPPKP